MTKSQLIFAKLDPGFYTNRKVRRAGRDAREVFLWALCMNAQRGAKGSIPVADLDPEYVSEMLLISAREVQNGVERACNAGLLTIDGNQVLIGGWDQDWSRRPLTNAERQAKFRSRNDDSVTSNDEVTRNGSEERRGEEREGALRARDSLSGFDLPAKGAVTRAARGANQQPLSADWKPTNAAAAIAHSLGLDLGHEARQFALNAAAKGHTFANADAAFEKFLGQSRDAGKARPKPKPGSRTTTPRRARTRTEDGSLWEEDDDGNMRLVQEQAGATL